MPVKTVSTRVVTVSLKLNRYNCNFYYNISGVANLETNIL